MPPKVLGWSIALHARESGRSRCTHLVLEIGGDSGGESYTQTACTLIQPKFARFCSTPEECGPNVYGICAQCLKRAGLYTGCASIGGVTVIDYGKKIAYAKKKEAREMQKVEDNPGTGKVVGFTAAVVQRVLGKRVYRIAKGGREEQLILNGEIINVVDKASGNRRHPTVSDVRTTWFVREAEALRVVK